MPSQQWRRRRDRGSELKFQKIPTHIKWCPEQQCFTYTVDDTGLEGRLYGAKLTAGGKLGGSARPLWIDFN
jgi:hypothetical protein